MHPLQVTGNQPGSQSVRKAPNHIKLPFVNSALAGFDKWLIYEEPLTRMYPHFLGNLAFKHPGLGTKEIRICALTLLGCTANEIADVLGVDPQSVHRARSRLWHKLGLEGPEFLLPYLHELANNTDIARGGG